MLFFASFLLGKSRVQKEAKKKASGIVYTESRLFSSLFALTASALLAFATSFELPSSDKTSPMCLHKLGSLIENLLSLLLFFLFPVNDCLQVFSLSLFSHAFFPLFAHLLQRVFFSLEFLQRLVFDLVVLTHLLIILLQLVVIALVRVVILLDQLLFICLVLSSLCFNVCLEVCNLFFELLNTQLGGFFPIFLQLGGGLVKFVVGSLPLNVHLIVSLL